MFHFSLLAVSEKATNIVTWISLGAILALIIALVLICVFNKKYSTNEIAYAGLCIAASAALSFVKVSPVTYGGSITLASFVPVLIYAYKCGPIKGTIAGIILGLFNFISGPYILTPMTFVLDYLLAFASIGLMGFAKMLPKLPQGAKVAIGTVAVYVFRFVFHLVSGVIYFQEGAIWADLPTPNSFVYSFIYQCVYLPGDFVISLGVLLALVKTKTLDKLMNLMSKKQKAEIPETEEDAAVEPDTTVNKDDTKE